MFFIMIPISVCVFANRETDSLNAVIQKYEKQSHFESDTNYIKSLIGIAQKLESANLDSSLLYSTKAYELSTKLGHLKLIIESGFAMISIYTKKGDAQKMLQIGNEILPIAAKIDRKLLGKAYNTFGIVYAYKAKDDRAYLYQSIDMIQKALVISEEYNDTDMIIKELNNLSVVFIQINDYSSAVECFYKAIRVAEKSEKENAYAISILYYNLSEIYWNQGKYDKANIEIQKGIEVAKRNNEMVSLKMCLYMAGMIYLAQNSLDEAMACINQSLELSQQLNITLSVLDSKLALSKIYCRKGLYREAIYMAQEVLDNWKKPIAVGDLVKIKQTIAEIHLTQKQYHLSLKTYNEILESGVNNFAILTDVHLKMSSIYEVQNNGIKALEHYKQYKIYSDSLFHNNLDEQIINLEAQNKYEKKEMELKAEQELKEAGFIKDKARLQLIIAFVLILFVSMLVFMIFILRSRRQLKKAYSELTYANIEIQQQKEELSAQSEELKTTNEHLVKLIKFKQDISGMIVHDLKNPLSIMLGLTTDRKSVV